MYFPWTVVLVELVQGIEAAEAGPCVHPLRIHPTLFVIALDCQGLVLDVHEGNPVHGILVVGDLHTASVEWQISLLLFGASVLVPNLGDERVPFVRNSKRSTAAPVRPPAIQMELLEFVLISGKRNLCTFSRSSTKYMLVPLLGEEGPSLRRVLLTPGDEPVQRREALEHGRQLVHKDLPL